MLNDYDKSIDGNQRSGAERHSNRSNSNAARRKSGSPLDFKKSYARYVAMARAAALKGDAVETENCYQHAEHFFRVMNARSSTPD